MSGKVNQNCSLGLATWSQTTYPLPMVRYFLLAWLAGVSVSAGTSEKVRLVRTPDAGIQPQAAVDQRGTIHLIYFKGEANGGDIFYVHSRENEKDFSRPIRVNTQAGSVMAVGSIRGAQLAVGKNGRVHVAWDGMGK